MMAAREMPKPSVVSGVGLALGLGWLRLGLRGDRRDHGRGGRIVAGLLVMATCEMPQPSVMSDVSVSLGLWLGRFRLGLPGNLGRGCSRLMLFGLSGRPGGLGWLRVVVQPLDHGGDRRRGLGLARGGAMPARVRRPLVGSLRLGRGRNGGQAQGKRNSLH
jgi:hypothetical protein